MKDGLENIDKIFKETFEGFEANVDPSVWSSIQNSIGSSGSTTPQMDPSSVASVAGKSLAAKIVAGIAIVGAVATSAYFVPKLFVENESIVAENIVSDEVPINVVEENVISEEIVDNNETTENTTQSVKTIENVETIDVSVKTSKAERKDNTTQSIEGTDAGATSSTTTESQLETSLTNTLTPSNYKADKKVKEEITTSTTVKKPEKLSVKINVDIIKGTAPLVVQFDAISQKAEKYFWDFSDGTEEVIGNSPVHIFQKEGTYRVKLSGIDKYGNSEDDYITIIVEKDYNSSISKLQNIFTPNGDGQNDYIKIRGKNIEKLEVSIFDNRGLLIYTLTSTDDMWDGKDKNGNYVPQGQYYMSGMAIGKDGKKHSIKQAVNVRR